MGTYFVEIRPYLSLSADITEYLAILSVSRMVLIPRKQVAENQEFLLGTVKYYYITSVTKKRKRAYALFLFLASLHQLSLYQQLESLRHVLYRQKLQMRQFFHLFDPVLRDDALRETQSLHLR